MIEVSPDKIKEYMKKAGLKQKTIAEISGLDEMKLCMVLQGKRKFEAGEYLSVCEAMGVPAQQFVKGNDEGSIKLGGKEYKEIRILKEDELLVSITNQDVIEKDGYTVMCVPVS